MREALVDTPTRRAAKAIISSGPIADLFTSRPNLNIKGLYPPGTNEVQLFVRAAWASSVAK